MVVDNCGNLVVAPDFVDSWCVEKREAIVKYFIHTAINPVSKYDSGHFELFVPPV